MFIFRKPHNDSLPCLKLQQFSKSCSHPEKYFVFFPVTSSRLYLRERDRGEKERAFVLRKSYIIQSDSSN